VYRGHGLVTIGALLLRFGEAPRSVGKNRLQQVVNIVLLGLQLHLLLSRHELVLHPCQLFDDFLAWAVEPV